MSARAVSFATVCLCLGLAASGCHDIRDREGTWTGERVGQAAALRVGMADQVRATLVVEEASLSWLRARLTTDDDVFRDALIQPNPGAEADVLAGMSFDGSPLRVFLAFVETTDGGGAATCLVALYPDERIEIRVMRGPPVPLYGILVLERG